MIEVKDLYKRYGKTVAVNKLSFHVDKGKVYGFLGSNGAGKSTTMNIIAGYIGATSGQVIIDGIDLKKKPEEAKKKIGYMPEVLPLYQNMRVHEYLVFAAQLKRVNRNQIELDVKEIENKTNLLKNKDRLIRNLSKGYKQRVGLAQAMIGNPELIILDEPTVGLDPKQVVEVRNLILSLKKDHTVLISSHNLAEIQEICDRIIIINKGELVAIDTPEALAEKCGNHRVINMTVKGEREDICDILDSMEYVMKYSFINDSPELNSYHVEVTVNGNDEVRDQIFYLFADRKIPIIEMNMNYESLEDIFLKLTEEAQ